MSHGISQQMSENLALKPSRHVLVRDFSPSFSCRRPHGIAALGPAAPRPGAAAAPHIWGAMAAHAGIAKGVLPTSQTSRDASSLDPACRVGERRQHRAARGPTGAGFLPPTLQCVVGFMPASMRHAVGEVKPVSSAAPATLSNSRYSRE
jgi:hypothetical protein